MRLQAKAGPTKSRKHFYGIKAFHNFLLWLVGFRISKGARVSQKKVELISQPCSLYTRKTKNNQGFVKGAQRRFCEENMGDKMFKKLLITLPALAVIAACDEGSSGSSNAASAPTAAQQACLRDVTATTGNPDVVLLSSQGSEAGTLVKVGVGPDRAPWQCIAYSDGTTDGIESLTNEGTL